MANPAIDNDIAFSRVAFTILRCITGLILGRIRYSIPVEMNIGSFVGNIAEQLRLNVPQLSARKFRLTSDDGDLKISVENGVLTVREKIDREHLCGEATVCNIHFELILENPLVVCRVVVENLGVNDNSSMFRGSRFVLQMAEAISPGVRRFPFESADNRDIGIITVASYTISSTEYFRVTVQNT